MKRIARPRSEWTYAGNKDAGYEILNEKQQPIARLMRRGGEKKLAELIWRAVNQTNADQR